jgi:3-oxoacyl-[acyl-carrier protein] reductase
MDLELKDKTALVFGAGGAIARTLGQEGAKVAVADVNYDAAKNTTADITANGGNAISLA